jgi:hypothetical protein
MTCSELLLLLRRSGWIDPKKAGDIDKHLLTSGMWSAITALKATLFAAVMP